ncbi:MAG TPA: class I SAM-dependent methyltransferase [Jatrophihabitans sp.]
MDIIEASTEERDPRGGSLSLWLQRRRLDVGKPFLRGNVLDFGSHHGVLTNYVSADRYLGVEHDPVFIEKARQLHPTYTFVTELPKDQKFDTVAAFALIEHIKDPGALIAEWASVLAPGGQIVMTTPHPKFEWIHTLGARVGLFSHHAHDDHEDLIDKKLMTKLGAPSALAVTTYKRFLFGANQLFVLSHR